MKDDEKEKAKVIDTEDLGLQQQTGAGAEARGMAGQHGEASEGTAERQARIGEAQLEAERKRKRS